MDDLAYNQILALSIYIKYFFAFKINYNNQILAN